MFMTWEEIMRTLATALALVAQVMKVLESHPLVNGNATEEPVADPSDGSNVQAA